MPPLTPSRICFPFNIGFFSSELFQRRDPALGFYSNFNSQDQGVNPFGLFSLAMEAINDYMSRSFLSHKERSHVS
jgi:hypothetical protein